MLTGDCRYDSTKLKFQRSCISASVRYSWYENKDTYTDKHTYIHTYINTHTQTHIISILVAYGLRLLCSMYK